MSYAVRIVYPKRRGQKGKRDLVVQKKTRAEAIAYAKKVAARGKRNSLTSPGGRFYIEGVNNPTACVYNLKSWGTKPSCFRFGWVPTKTRTKVKSLVRKNMTVPSGFKAASVVKVPYTALNGH